MAPESSAFIAPPEINADVPWTEYERLASTFFICSIKYTCKLRLATNFIFPRPCPPIAGHALGLLRNFRNLLRKVRMHKPGQLWNHASIVSATPRLDVPNDMPNMPSFRPVANPPDQSRLSIPGIRVDEAVARFAGNEERYRYWLDQFVQRTPDSCKQIRAAILDGDTDAAARLIHALKGRAGMLGMTELHGTAQALEAALSQAGAACVWLEKFERVTDETLHSIRSAIAPPMI